MCLVEIRQNKPGEINNYELRVFITICTYAINVYRMATLTLPVCKKKENYTLQMTDTVAFTISDTIDSVASVWQNISGNNIFLSPLYLKGLEMTPAEGITPYYVVIRVNNEVLGVCYFQWKYFRLQENIRDNEEHKKTIFDKFKRAVIRNINFPTLVLGNLLVTGEHGFVFSADTPLNVQWELISKAVDEVSHYIRKKGRPVGLVLAKDFYSSHNPEALKNEFIEFSVQPTMNMPLSPDWHSFDDYTYAMKSKYRVRLKKARKDMEALTTRTFTTEEIFLYKTEIFNLYRNVSDQAGFNTFLLHPDYFENLKNRLGDQMTFTSYWKDNQLIGFSSTIEEESSLHAHFLGYDKNTNKYCQLYLNMLYDLVEQAIAKHKAAIDFSRTAIEIKSTVGAKDTPLFLYIKHVNPIWNKMVSPILNLVKPDKDYIIRHPFRDEEVG